MQSVAEARIKGYGYLNQLRLSSLNIFIPFRSPIFPSSLSYASQQDLAVMRKVYDFCSQHGVYPEISQYNR